MLQSDIKKPSSKKVHDQTGSQVKKPRTQERFSVSTNSMRHKMPQIISKYIADQAKMNNVLNPPPKANKFNRAAARMTLSKKLSSKFHRKKCQICESEVAANELMSLSSCEHLYCASCLHQYILYKIGVFENVECPNQSCRNVLEENTRVYSQLPLDARKKFKKIKQYHESLKNPDRRLCPNEQCEGFLDVPKGKQNEIMIANPKCTVCFTVFCSKCFFKQHDGECDPHQLNFFQDTLHYRQCKRCKNVIEKSSGCNHMTCRCGYQFCYICGAKWRHDHLCNNPDGEPIQQHPDCQCCCFACNCCECCQECCDNCGDNCEECCDACCQPYCQALGNCCDAVCGCCDEDCCSCCDDPDCCSCCQSSCCKCFGRSMFFLVWVLLIVPFFYLWVILVLSLQLFAAIFMGLFAAPCIYCSEEDPECWQIILGIIFFPITYLFMIGYSFKVLMWENSEEFSEMCCLPCEMLQEVWDD